MEALTSNINNNNVIFFTPLFTKDVNCTQITFGDLSFSVYRVSLGDYLIDNCSAIRPPSIDDFMRKFRAISEDKSKSKSDEYGISDWRSRMIDQKFDVVLPPKPVAAPKKLEMKMNLETAEEIAEKLQEVEVKKKVSDWLNNKTMTMNVIDNDSITDDFYSCDNDDDDDIEDQMSSVSQSTTRPRYIFL